MNKEKNVYEGKLNDKDRRWSTKEYQPSPAMVLCSVWCAAFAPPQIDSCHTDPHRQSTSTRYRPIWTAFYDFSLENPTEILKFQQKNAKLMTKTKVEMVFTLNKI